MASITWLVINPSFEPLVTTIVLFAALWLSAVKEGLQIQKKNINLTVSLLGNVNYGKSVFLSVLFDQIQQDNIESYASNLSTTKTIELINKNIYRLNSGKFLSRTPLGKQNYFKASLNRKNIFKNIDYDLTMCDLSGETTQNLIYKELWIHTDKRVMNEIITSDAIWLAIDASSSDLDWTIQNYMALLQILQKQRKKYSIVKDISVSIIFMKSDTMKVSSNKEYKSIYLKKVSGIEKLCSSLFGKVNIFFTSAVGEIISEEGEDHTDMEFPVAPIKPENIAAPLIWTLATVKNKI